MLLLAESVNTGIGWPGAICTCAVCAAVAFMVWAMCKYDK